MSDESQSSGTCGISGTSPVSTGGAPTWTRDTTADYNEQCQISLCFLIAFTNRQLIRPGRLTVSLSSLKNPPSVKTTGEIEVTSLMKYDSDTKYSKIDKYKGASAWRATKGLIVSNLM